MEDIIEIAESLEESVLLINEIIEIIKNETKEQKRGFTSKLLRILAFSLLENLLAGQGVIRACESTNRAKQDFNAAHSLINFEIRKHHQNEPKLKGGLFKK